MVRLKIVSTTDYVRKKLFEEIKQEIKSRLYQSRAEIKIAASNIIMDGIKNSPTVASLLGGELKYDFGLTSTEVSTAINKMLSIIHRNIGIDINFNDSGLSMTIQIGVSDEYINELSEISYDSNGHDIRWMEWLLTKGTTVVVNGFEVKYLDKFSEASRNGYVIMIPSGGTFRVNPQYAGNVGSNFISRVIEDVSPKLASVLTQYLVQLKIARI